MTNKDKIKNCTYKTQEYDTSSAILFKKMGQKRYIYKNEKYTRNLIYSTTAFSVSTISNKSCEICLVFVFAYIFDKLHFFSI